MTTARLISTTTIAVAIDHDGPLCGLALLGPSGAGKTQLALSLIDGCPFRRTMLISDDVSQIDAENGQLFAGSPARTAHAIEHRSTGIGFVSIKQRYLLRLALHLSDTAERMPDDPPDWQPLGDDLPGLPAHYWPRGGEGLRLYLRAVLSGHSRRGRFDTIPGNFGQDQSI